MIELFRMALETGPDLNVPDRPTFTLRYQVPGYWSDRAITARLDYTVDGEAIGEVETVSGGRDPASNVSDAVAAACKAAALADAARWLRGWTHDAATREHLTRLAGTVECLRVTREPAAETVVSWWPDGRGP